MTLSLISTTRILSFAAADDFHKKQLRLDEASYVMEILQTELDRISTHKDTLRRNYLKSIRHLNRVHGVLPPSMFLTGLARESATAVTGGGFADVWIGRLDKQRVCVKVLRFFQEGSDREKLLRELSKEVLLWRQLHHPNILPFLGVNTELFTPSFCIVSPWMSNGDIMAYARNSSLDLGTKLQHIIQIAEGLLYLHGLDPPVVHGDIKGANILISDDHRCCLADFGLSVLDTQSMNPTVTATVQGSLRWLAPEFINPTPMPTRGRLTTRDIYAFGCTVFEILTGQPPFCHLSLDISVAIDVLKGVRPVLSSTVVPKEAVFKLIHALLDSCWAEEITRRPDAQNVLDFLKHIHALLSIPETEFFPSLWPVLNRTGTKHNVSNDAGCGTQLSTKLGDNYPSSDSELSNSLGIVHCFSMRAAPFSAPAVNTLTAFRFPQDGSPSGSISSSLDQDGSVTCVEEEPGMEWDHEVVQPPHLKLSSSSVPSRSIREFSPLPALSHQFLSPRTYRLMQEDAGRFARGGIFRPFNEDDEDDQIVWDPRPSAILTTPVPTAPRVHNTGPHLLSGENFHTASQASSSEDPPYPSRSQRFPLSCIECRRWKNKCDYGSSLPCERCKRKGLSCVLPGGTTRVPLVRQLHDHSLDELVPQLPESFNFSAPSRPTIPVLSSAPGSTRIVDNTYIGPAPSLTFAQALYKSALQQSSDVSYYSTGIASSLVSTFPTTSSAFGPSSGAAFSSLSATPFAFEAASGSSAFGAPPVFGKPAASTSAFGRYSTLDSTSLSGKPATKMFVSSSFGQTSTLGSNVSSAVNKTFPFGSPATTTSAFGAPATTSALGQPSALGQTGALTEFTTAGAFSAFADTGSSLSGSGASSNNGGSLFGISPQAAFSPSSTAASSSTGSAFRQPSATSSTFTFGSSPTTSHSITPKPRIRTVMMPLEGPLDKLTTRLPLISSATIASIQQQQKPIDTHSPIVQIKNDAPSRTWSDYALEEIDRLGEGAAGAIHKVKDNRTGRIMVRRTITTREVPMKQLEHELSILTSLKHVNVIQFHTVHISPSLNEVEILMEFCEGGSLESVGKQIKERNAFVGEKIAGRLAEGVLQGLTYLHTEKMIHRDIKPSNILLSREGIVKLCDFGLSGPLEGSVAYAFTGPKVYMAPERISGNEYTIRSDIWSAGISLLELVQNRFPFPNDLPPIELMMYITHGEPPQLEDEGDVVWSTEMKDFIKQSLTVDPSIRPTPKDMLSHPWILGTMKQEVSLSQWLHQVWGWERPSIIAAESTPAVSDSAVITDAGNSGALAKEMLERLKKHAVEEKSDSGEIKLDDLVNEGEYSHHRWRQIQMKKLRLLELRAARMQRRADHFGSDSSLTLVPLTLVPQSEDSPVTRLSAETFNNSTLVQAASSREPDASPSTIEPTEKPLKEDNATAAEMHVLTPTFPNTDVQSSLNVPLTSYGHPTTHHLFPTGSSMVNDFSRSIECSKTKPITSEPPVTLSEVDSRNPGGDGIGGGLTWADPDLWQVWKEYRDRQGHFELSSEDSAFVT